MWKEYDLLDEQKIHCLSPDLLKKIIQKFNVIIWSKWLIKRRNIFSAFLDDLEMNRQK